MKICEIHIKNYCSLHDITVYPKDILALVGRNSSGKSNLLKALEVFFEGSTKLIDDECFYNNKSDNPIEIFIAFEKLSDWEKQNFKPWMNEDKLIVGKKISCTSIGSYEITNLAVTKVPAVEWLQEDMINGKKISEWWAKKNELKIGKLDFEVKLGSSKPGVDEWKEIAKNFIEKFYSNIVWEPKVLENPKGYPNVLKGALPEFIYVPAVKDVSEETKVTKSNPFGKLLNSIFEKISQEQKNTLTGELNKIQKKLNRVGEKERIVEIKEIETRLNTLMREVMECDIEIEMAMPDLKEVLGGAKIYADDGIRTTIETKGHGLQRSMIFTILRAYAEMTHIQKAAEKSEERTTIFAIEEPELYLHPQSQRTSMSVFRKIASGKDQVIYSTHSGLFVDINYFDQICIMRREKKDKNYESYPTQLSMPTMLKDLKVRKGVDGTEKGIREQYSNAFNPVINEGFFADKIVIVEGPSEQYALPIYAEALKYDLDRNNISIIHSDGKGQMDRLLRVFNGFRIPTYLWFDGDKSTADKDIRSKTLELLELLKSSIKKIEDIKTNISDNYAILEYNLETTLKSEIKEYETIIEKAIRELGPIGKPLKHRFLAKELVKKGNSCLPGTIIKIVEKLKMLSYTDSILKG